MQSFLIKRFFLLFLFCCAVYFLGNNLFNITDPDESFYCLTAHEMAAKNEWMTPVIFGQPQFEKPPLTYWLLETAFNAWGESPFTARFFPALYAVMGVLAVYFLGLVGFRDERKAFFSAMVLATGAFYMGMGKMVFTDMIFTVLILYALAFFLLAYTDRHRHAVGLVGFYVFCALSTLTKSPLGFLIAQATVVIFLLYQRQLRFLKNGWVAVGLLLYLVIALPWYVYIYDQYGQAFVHEFFYNDHWRRLIAAEHRANDHWFFYPATMIIGLFPWSLILIAAGVDLFKRFKSSVTLMDHLNFSWLITVLAIFQVAHSKLASYILPLFPALSLMTGNFLGNVLSQIQQRKRVENLLYASFVVPALLGIVIVVAHRVYVRYVPSPMPMYFLSGSLIALAGLGTTLVIKERFQEALYLLALTLLPVLSTVFIIRTDIEKYVSSHEACEYIPPRAWQSMTVLTSKYNARGVRYFTGQDVAVINNSNQPFFSPHPVPVLDTADKIIGKLKKQRLTFGVVRKNIYQQLLKDCGSRYHVVLLRIMGYDYVVRIEALKPS